ncbi:MAG: ABC transporter permease [Nanoarchaeota archaeon]|nr:ABC transporter permease [Nanoarchaeota archaeon]MBU1051727.1 ABC transporter permease [Nanoarchaeota archaeon]MBU1988977.1 ABC transporter permease [Nanoarchaeota archaeon]
MLTDYLALAFKNVRKRGIRSWLTMLGVFIGIAAVVSLISLGQGLETAISGQFGALSTDTLTIQGADTGFSPPGSTAVTPMTQQDVDIIEKVSGVRMTIPRYLRAGKVTYNDILGFSYVASGPHNNEMLEELYKSVNMKAAQGKLVKATDRGKIAIGDDFVKNDAYGKKIKLGSRIDVQGKDFEVIGILERSSTFMLNGAILMLDDDMKDIFEIQNDKIDFIIVKVEDDADIEEVANEIERKLRKDRDQKLGEEDFEVQTPSQSVETVGTIVSVINIVVTGIALIALLVGGIGIANTMFTSVLERTREIGVMKAIGAQNKDILAVFIIEAGLLGLIGGIVGALIGLAMALGVAGAANSALGESLFQVAPSIPLLVGSLSFSLLIGVLSGIVPAYQASKLNPVDALRK